MLKRLLIALLTCCFFHVAGLAQTTLVCSTDGGSGCNQAIPDNDTNGIEASITVPPGICSGLVGQIDVGVDLHHTWVGDLVLTLTHDSTGTTVTLLDRFETNGNCNGDDIDALFSDGASGPGCSTVEIPTINGSVAPAEALSFPGEQESGAWTLQVVDAAANETGELFDWDLTVTCALPGITVFPTSGLTTTEPGGTAQFNVVLNTVPSSNVIINLSSLDPTEGTVSPSSLTFTPANALTPQPVTVTGVQDVLVDGDIPYTVQTDLAISTDPTYSGINPADVFLNNEDDDDLAGGGAGGITVTPISGLITTEQGGSDTFTVVLDTVPSSDVVINLQSDDPSEGTASPSTLTFTPGNALTAQTVTVTGEDDNFADGDRPYHVILSPATSGDSDYHTLDPDNVSVTNQDDPNDTGIPPSDGPAAIPTLGEWAMWLLMLLLMAMGLRALRRQETGQ